MNIGIVVDNELNDDKRVLREINILKEYGYNIFILCFGFDNRSYPDIEGIHITRIRMKKSFKNLLFFFLNSIPVYEWLLILKIKKFILRNTINILHVHDLYLSRSAYFGISRSKNKIPLVLDLHENYPYAIQTYNWTKGLLRSFISRPGKWQSKEKKYLRYPEKIIVLSEEFKNDLSDRYNFLKREDFCVLPNVPDLSQMEKFVIDKDIIKFDKKAPIILYFGVIGERRGIFDAMDAFKNIVKKGFKALFLIIGPVDKKDRERFFSYLNADGMSDHFLYIPWIDLSELPTYLDVSDICLAPFIKNPQHESGVANKIYDYMLGKKPIIASDCRPQQKLIQKYNCGIIYSNETELTDAIIKLLGDSFLRRQMGENGYDAIIKDHNTGVVKHNLIEMYDSLKSEIKKNTLG
jgi:glycosyltransferase involved in cell wall biosynthesis